MILIVSFVPGALVGLDSTQYLFLFLKCNYNTLSDEDLAVLERGVQEGRNGKGTIYGTRDDDAL